MQKNDFIQKSATPPPPPPLPSIRPLVPSTRTLRPRPHRWAVQNLPPQAVGPSLIPGITSVSTIPTLTSGGPSPAYANTPTRQAWDAFDEEIPVHSPGWPSPRNSPDWNPQGRPWGSGSIQVSSPRSGSSSTPRSAPRLASRLAGAGFALSPPPGPTQESRQVGSGAARGEALGVAWLGAGGGEEVEVAAGARPGAGSGGEHV